MGAATPFTISFFKPPVLKAKTVDNNGRLQVAPLNVYKQVTRKSVTLDAFLNTRICQVTTIIEVPAGAEVYDGDNVRAAISAHIGLLNQQSSGIAATVATGIL